MAKKASSEDLSAAFNEHLEQTRGQVKRLEQIFEMLGKAARGKKCDSASLMISSASAVSPSIA